MATPKKAAPKKSTTKKQETETMTAEQAKEEDKKLKKAEQAARAKKRREKINTAKKVLRDYMNTTADLPDEIKAAISALAVVKRTREAANTFQTFLNEKFPSVGAVVNEFDIFKETKMGMREFQKRCTDLAARTRKYNKENPDEPRIVMTFDYNETSGDWTRTA